MDYVDEHWNFARPTDSQIGDRDVSLEGPYLLGKRIALLVTGGIAAMKSPELARGLRRMGAEVTCYLSPEGERYVGRDALEWACKGRLISKLSSNSEHLGTDAPFDAYLVAPATYNIINKMAAGVADSLISTTLASARGLVERKQSRIFVAPTMHGLMHNSVLDAAMQKLHSLGVEFAPPRDENGKHNLPVERDLIFWLIRRMAKTSPLAGRKILVTGGPTPVPLDSVRRIVTRFRGRTGMQIADELWLHGADVKLILGAGLTPPSIRYLPIQTVHSYDEYRDAVLKSGQTWQPDLGIFSAAVADYLPTNVHPGKIASGLESLTITLHPARKVIDEVQKLCPALKIISFKLEDGLNDNQLLDIGRLRISTKNHTAVVLNHARDTGKSADQHRTLLLTAAGKITEFPTLRTLAEGMVAFCEEVLREGPG